MKKFVVYEVWTRSYVVDAETIDAALSSGDEATDEFERRLKDNGFEGIDHLSLSNWHAVEVE